MRDAAGCWLLLRLLPLGEDVPVGAAVLHGDSVATVWCGVADGVERAVLIIISDVLQHRRVPHETKTAVFHLKIKKKYINITHRVHDVQKGASSPRVITRWIYWAGSPRDPWSFWKSCHSSLQANISGVILIYISVLAWYYTAYRATHCWNSVPQTFTCRSVLYASILCAFHCSCLGEVSTYRARFCTLPWTILSCLHYIIHTITEYLHIGYWSQCWGYHICKNRGRRGMVRNSCFWSIYLLSGKQNIQPHTDDTITLLVHKLPQ